MAAGLAGVVVRGAELGTGEATFTGKDGDGTSVGRTIGVDACLWPLFRYWKRHPFRRLIVPSS